MIWPAWIADLLPAMPLDGIVYCWPAVLFFAAMAAWLVHNRLSRWNRIALDGVTVGMAGRAPRPQASIPAPDAATPITTPGAAPLAFAPGAVDLDRGFCPAQIALPLGADLAERARFVARRFAVSEACTAAHDPAGHSLQNWPLRIHCQPARFTLTLRQAVLRYRLRLDNRGAEALGPLMIRADLVAAAWTAQDRQTRFEGDQLPLCHYFDGLAAGDHAEVTGELRLLLRSIVTIRLGPTELLLPLLRLHAESAGNARPWLNMSACFAIGPPPVTAGGGIQPFALDSAPRIWRRLSARQLTLADSP